MWAFAPNTAPITFDGFVPWPKAAPPRRDPLARIKRQVFHEIWGCYAGRSGPSSRSCRWKSAGLRRALRAHTA